MATVSRVPELDETTALHSGATTTPSAEGAPWHPLLVAVMPLVSAIGAGLHDADGRLLAGPDLPEGRDVPLLFDGLPVGRVRLPEPDGLPPLQHALDHLLRDAERRHGIPLDQLSRTDKQQVVADLDARGAFVLRKGVEDVADVLGVSRFTVYNYLSRAHDDRRPPAEDGA